MAITKEYASGTVVAIQARATISGGNPELLEYAWKRVATDGRPDPVLSTELTSGVATIITTVAGTYYVQVSHPNADTVTSDTFTITYRAPRDILRLIYHRYGVGTYSDGSFTDPVVLDWNIAAQQYEFGPDTGNGFGTPTSGWWRLFAKEKNLSLDITIRGASGNGNGGEGGVGSLRRTFEQGQLYTIRVGDRRNVDGDDPAINAPNPGRVLNGNGSFGGGCSYVKRGGTLIAVVGGGGGQSGNGNKGGSGGGLNVPGQTGEGNNRPGGRVVNPGNTIITPGYPSDGSVRIMSACGDNGSQQLICSVELTASDVQNNGGFGSNGGGGGGSGLEGGYGGQSSSQGGSGGSGWASGAVSIIGTQLGGNAVGKNGSCRIRQTGFVNYIASWYHVTGVRQGLTPSFNLTNTGNFNLQVIPQNVGFVTGEGGVNDKHYFVRFPESFGNTNYTINFTYVGRLIAAGTELLASDPIPTIFDKQSGSFRVKFINPADGGSPHIREVAFSVYPG